MVEKETLAILKSLSFFKNIVFNEKITCYTDNQNLLAETDISRRTDRWKLLLAEYDIIIKHIKGSDNIAAYYMNRLNALQNTHSCENSTFSILIKKYQTSNDKFVFRSVEEEEEFLTETHKLLIHPDIDKHLKILKNKVSIKNLQRKIARINANCEACNLNKHFKICDIKTEGRFEASRPFQKVAIDLKGPIATREFNTNFETS